jgi:hypothetical protein
VNYGLDGTPGKGSSAARCGAYAETGTREDADDGVDPATNDGKTLFFEETDWGKLRLGPDQHLSAARQI